MNTVILLSWIGVVLTGSILLPQIFKALWTKKTDDVSFWHVFINIASNVIWIVASILGRDDNPMWAALVAVNVISSICAITLTILMLCYNKKNK